MPNSIEDRARDLLNKFVKKHGGDPIEYAGNASRGPLRDVFFSRAFFNVIPNLDEYEINEIIQLLESASNNSLSEDQRAVLAALVEIPLGATNHQIDPDVKNQIRHLANSIGIPLRREYQ